MITTGCPSHAELSEFVLGNLSRPVLARVAGHVANCPACETVLWTFDDLVDSLLTRLRQPQGNDAVPVEVVPPPLVAAARSARGQSSSLPRSASSMPRRLGKFELLEELGL